MSEKSFLRFISYLQIIGIILVVFGHSFHEYPDGSEGKSLLLYRMPYSFRMPLFIFVSGFLLYYTTLYKNRNVGIKKFFSQKFKRLLIPYLVLGIVTFIPRVYMSDMADDRVELSLHSLLYSLIDSNHLVIPFFWFIQVSFVLLIVSYTIMQTAVRLRIRQEWIVISLLVISLLLPYLPFDYSSIWAAYQFPRLSVYFFLGIAYCMWHKTIDRLIPWTSFLTLFISAGIWVFIFFLPSGIIQEWGCGTAGIMMCLSLAKILENKHLHFLDHLSGANYLIFLLSWYCNVATQQVLHHFTEWPWWTYTLMSLTAGIYIPWLFYKFMQRHRDHKTVKFLSFLLGQRS